MARNRKRAKDRRARRPESVAASQARRKRSAPSPIGHAAPDVELAEAQLEAGRPDGEEPDEHPDLVDQPDGRSGIVDEADGGSGVVEEADGGSGVVDEAVEEPEEDDFEELDSVGSATADGSDGDGAASSRGGRDLAVPAGAVPEHRWVGGRFLHFLQGSWRELQRVQWPDRRQVVQATGVVIGFVIVAGLFLGAADWLSGQITNFILK